MKKKRISTKEKLTLILLTLTSLTAIIIGLYMDMIYRQNYKLDLFFISIFFLFTGYCFLKIGLMYVYYIEKNKNKIVL